MSFYVIINPKKIYHKNDIYYKKTSNIDSFITIVDNDKKRKNVSKDNVDEVN